MQYLAYSGGKLDNGPEHGRVLISRTCPLCGKDFADEIKVKDLEVGKLC